MYRLRLVVADNDEEYLRGFCAYINEEHRSSVSIVSFTRADSLKKYILSGEKADVLLICTAFASSEVSEVWTGMIILLTEGEGLEEVPCINKYQNGEKLLARIIEIFTEENGCFENMFEAGSRTRVVSVYSPCGGAGKTTVAINMAVQASLMGKSVFYLNLEPYSSSLYMLSGQGPKCLSNILLHVREGNQIRAVVSTARVRDMKYNVEFFIPPESGAELSELSREYTAGLLMSIRGLNAYDLVVVDTDSSINEKNMAVLGDSEKIVLVTTQDSLCSYKTRLMREEIKKAGLSIEDRILTVVNRFREGTGGQCSEMADLWLPLVEEVVLKNDRSGFMEFNSYYAGHILRLTQMVLSNG